MIIPNDISINFQKIFIKNKIFNNPKFIVPATNGVYIDFNEEKKTIVENVEVVKNIATERKKRGKKDVLKKLNKNKKKKKTVRTKSSIDKTKNTIRLKMLTLAKTIKQINKVYFLTITFPENTPDEIAEKIFNNSITTAKKNYILSEYLRVSERQQNGTIHYHLFVLKYVNIQKLNEIFKNSLHYYYYRGKLICKWESIVNYNGVDIAKDRKTKKVINFIEAKRYKTLLNYVTKYITKGNFESFKRGWSCSRFFSNICTTVRYMLDDIRNELIKLKSSIKKVYTTEYGKLIFGKFDDFNILIKDLTAINYNMYLLHC